MVVGLDLSYRGVVGWAALDDTGSLLGHGGFRICEGPKDDDQGRALCVFQDAVRKLIRHNVVVVGYERVVMHYGIRAAQLYGAVEGVLLMTCQSEGVPVTPCSVQAIKKAATGNGAAKKDEVIPAANLTWGLDLGKRDHDVADALWCAEVARRKRHGGKTAQQIAGEFDGE